MIRPPPTPSAGITLIETIACLLLLAIGCVAVLGLVLYGIALSERAQQAATGMQTARTILVDPAPIGLVGRSVSGDTISGYINGYFVRRTSAVEADLSATGNAIGIATITAEVFHARNGTLVATLKERQVRIRQP